MKKLLILLFLMSQDSYSGIFGPSSYEECVSDGKTGRSEKELSLLIDLCSSKFPKPKSIFNHSGNFVRCQISKKNNYINFKVKVNSDKTSEIENYTGYRYGKVISSNNNRVETLFKNISTEESIEFVIINDGVTFMKDKGTYMGNCRE